MSGANEQMRHPMVSHYRHLGFTADHKIHKSSSAVNRFTTVHRLLPKKEVFALVGVGSDIVITLARRVDQRFVSSIPSLCSDVVLHFFA